MGRPALTLAHSKPTALDYLEHEGRRVVWGPWKLTDPTSHIVHTCDGCERAGEPWVSVGIVHPLPGDTFPVPTSRTGPLPGPLRNRSAWPVPRLFAYRCAACSDIHLYDTVDGDQWQDIPYTNLTL